MKIFFHFPSIILLLLSMLNSTLAYSLSITRGPYLQMASQTSMTIRWRTDTPSESVVHYGTTSANLNNTQINSNNTTEHEVRISSLLPLTTYYYSVGNNTEILAGGDNSYRFITSADIGNSNPTRVWLIGDSGTANSNAAAVYTAYQNYLGYENTNLWIMLGDNAYESGTDGEYQNAVFNMYPELLRRSPLWATLGNHDGRSADSDSESGVYYDIFSFPRNAEAGGIASGTEAYYSFDYGDIHFVSLDSYETNRSANGAMMTWLENDLASNDKKWLIAFWHHPPYTKGSHNSDNESALIDMRTIALPILESYGVDLVFTGHSHSYERSFLIDGHYGSSNTFNALHLIDNGDGREDGNGAYQKNAQTIDAGTVYTVAGASGKISGGALNHPAMFTSLNQLGSVILDINTSRLDVKYLRSNGTITDYFSIIKGEDTSPPIITTTASTQNEIIVTFNESVDKITAEDITNYNINKGIDILAVNAADNIVTLSVSSLSIGVTYTLSINNIEDISNNVIAVNTQTSFSFQNLQTTIFQTGVSPSNQFDGTEDSYIASGKPNQNFAFSSEILADGSDGVNGELASLVKWDVNVIPNGSTITEVKIELDVFNRSSGGYNIYAGTVPWTENNATWNSIDPLNSRGSQIANFLPSNTGRYTINLDANGIAMVQSWIGSTENHGVLIMTGGTVDGIDMRSSEYSSLTQRPKLIVTYQAGAGNMPPNSNFSYIINDLNVDFFSTSSDTDGQIVSWAWNFGDGSSATTENPSHLYANSNTYQVTLTVIDNDGASHSNNQNLTVSELIDIKAPSIPTGLSTTDVTSNSVTLSWSPSLDNIGVAGYIVFQDGLQVANVNNTGFSAIGLGSNTSYQFSVEAYDLAGNQSGPSSPEQVTTDNLPPDANFTYTGNQLNIAFSDTSSDSDGNLVAWQWDFGDESVSTLQHPTHNYTDAGSYNVTLVVTDSNGATGSISQNITVSSSNTPITSELQQGVNNYTGAQDTYVAEGRSRTNYGTARAILADGDDGSRDELISLLQWDVSSIPEDATITKVSINLQVFNRTSNVYNLWGMGSSWSANSATWRNTTPETNRGKNIGSFKPTSTGSYTITLNTSGIALVQSWVHDMATNNGLTIESKGTRNGIDMRSNEYGVVSQRPKITITYQ